MPKPKRSVATAWHGVGDDDKDVASNHIVIPQLMVVAVMLCCAAVVVVCVWEPGACYCVVDFLSGGNFVLSRVCRAGRRRQ